MPHKFETQRPQIPDNGTTLPINSYVRGEAQKLINKQKKDLTVAQEKRIKEWSQGLKAIAALEKGEIKPNNACRDCSSKGYVLVRGDKQGDDPVTKKPVYEWEKTACGCIRFKFTPTDLKGLKYEAPTDKGKPAKKGTKPGKRPAGSRTPKKRTGPAK